MQLEVSVVEAFIAASVGAIVTHLGDRYLAGREQQALVRDSMNRLVSEVAGINSCLRGIDGRLDQVHTDISSLRRESQEIDSRLSARVSEVETSVARLLEGQEFLKQQRCD